MAGSLRLEGASALRAIPLRQALVHPVHLPRTAVQDLPTVGSFVFRGKVAAGAPVGGFSRHIDDLLGLMCIEYPATNPCLPRPCPLPFGRPWLREY